MKMDGSFLEEKSSFKILGLTFSSKLDRGSYILSTTKSASKKIGALICSMKFVSPEIALYLYKSTIWSCTEYCCHIWVGAPSCCLGLLDKLQKWIWRTLGPSLAVSLEPLFHRQNIASLIFSMGITLVNAHLNLLNWFHYVILEKSTRYSDRLLDFSVTTPRCYNDV